VIDGANLDAVTRDGGSDPHRGLLIDGANVRAVSAQRSAISLVKGPVSRFSPLNRMQTSNLPEHKQYWRSHRW